MSNGTTIQGRANDCLYTAMMSANQGQYSSMNEFKRSVAEVILTNPSFIFAIYPTLSLINQPQTPRLRENFMGSTGGQITKFSMRNSTPLKHKSV